jgi:hypothetical protein
MAKNKYIESPEALSQLFEDYKKECKSNPRKKHVFVGKDGTSDFELLERPLTMEGFRVYCFNKIGCVKHYFDNTDKRYNEYSTICHAIRDCIRLDQIEGGMVGQYNPSITQRLNGLTEKTETKLDNNHSGKIQIEMINSDTPLHSDEKDINLDV